jgi:L,D-transpeptidase ErfK/SrfK
MMAHDSFVYDQRKLVVLQKGTSILIPDSLKAETLKREMVTTTIDINIPEFKLRIFEVNKKLYEFPVRVGKNGTQFLEATNRLTDLRTKEGAGIIVAHHKSPVFYNPATNERYKFTKRDDGKITLMPRIPSIETKINGVRNGQLIHATTNPKTLEKAYSHGCIGTKEGDTWVIYYYAPVGTAINIRYALDIHENQEDQRILNDIYERIPGSETIK